MTRPLSQSVLPLRPWLLGVCLIMAGASSAAQSQTLPPQVIGDAIPAPLTATPGDAARGRAIVANRQVGLCLLCHAGPFPEERFQGNLAPDLSGAGSRWNEGQLRLRLVNSRHLNPESIMPTYFQTEGLYRVSNAVQGRPLLDAQQIEDVVALLRTLK
ncbi:sulfur oxidation c-type cytochrome SoxX [Polaromonas sp. YR568]|uniref:sulfur oxidation c-type cytochrome SoxX n=1 Tax=Polaromonas sp. YR568 TaxID=1855301 RepID=UPI003138159D